MTKAESEIGNANLNVVGGQLGNVRAMLDVRVDDARQLRERLNSIYDRNQNAKTSYRNLDERIKPLWNGKRMGYNLFER